VGGWEIEKKKENKRKSAEQKQTMTKAAEGIATSERVT
jgi:hypothetical protein